MLIKLSLVVTDPNKASEIFVAAEHELYCIRASMTLTAVPPSATGQV